MMMVASWGGERLDSSLDPDKWETVAVNRPDDLTCPFCEGRVTAKSTKRGRRGFTHLSSVACPMREESSLQEIAREQIVNAAREAGLKADPEVLLDGWMVDAVVAGPRSAVAVVYQPSEPKLSDVEGIEKAAAERGMKTVWIVRYECPWTRQVAWCLSNAISIDREMTLLVRTSVARTDGSIERDGADLMGAGEFLQKVTSGEIDIQTRAGNVYLFRPITVEEQRVAIVRARARIEPVTMKPPPGSSLTPAEKDRADATIRLCQELTRGVNRSLWVWVGETNPVPWTVLREDEVYADSIYGRNGRFGASVVRVASPAARLERGALLTVLVDPVPRMLRERTTLGGLRKTWLLASTYVEELTVKRMLPELEHRIVTFNQVGRLFDATPSIRAHAGKGRPPI